MERTIESRLDEANHLMSLTLNLHLNCDNSEENNLAIIARAKVIAGKGHWFCEDQQDTPNMLEATMLALRESAKAHKNFDGANNSCYAVTFLEQFVDYVQLALNVVSRLATYDDGDEYADLEKEFLETEPRWFANQNYPSHLSSKIPLTCRATHPAKDKTKC